MQALYESLQVSASHLEAAASPHHGDFPGACSDVRRSARYAETFRDGTDGDDFASSELLFVFDAPHPDLLLGVRTIRRTRRGVLRHWRAPNSLNNRRLIHS